MAFLTPPERRYYDRPTATRWTCDVNPESGNTEADGDPVVSADQTNPSARLAELEQRFSEVLLALRREPEPHPRDERQEQVDASSEDITPEVKTLWEDTVRRFTGSIDVRLDILEDELGGLQDELRRLQQVAQENSAGQVVAPGAMINLQNQKSIRAMLRS